MLHTTYIATRVLSLQFLEGMSQKIVKGIEEAQTDLSKEKQKKDEEVCLHVDCVNTLET